jgi:hypothetical protein
VIRLVPFVYDSESERKGVKKDEDGGFEVWLRVVLRCAKKACKDELTFKVPMGRRIECLQ